MLKRLYLHQFRNYSRTEITFSPGINWISGDNAQGKTNILEAVYLLCSGRSFRTPQLSQLIQQGKSFFYLEAEIEKDGVSQSIKLSYDGETKKVQYNQKSYSHFTPLIGLHPHVLYAPEDMAILSGAPTFRRRLLDMHLSQIDPLYLHHLARFHKALKQRNELLKRKNEEGLDPWDATMAQSAFYLIEKRKQLIEELDAPIREVVQELSSQNDCVQIIYEPSISSLPVLEALQKHRAKDLHLGTTLHGPHRDDLSFQLGGVSAKAYCSAGQKHSIVASLRLAQWHHLSRETGESPLFSIDDFGTHLDQTRQNNFQSSLSKLGQIFLTSPSVDMELFPKKQVIVVGSGKVLEIGST